MRVLTILLFTLLGSAPPVVSERTTGGCGNGVVEPGEACDDGNTANFDACPPDCMINECKSPGGAVVATIKVVGNATAVAGDLSALTIFIEYPDGKVHLPGKGSKADAGRFEAQNGSAQITANDLDYGARVLMVDPFQKLGATPLKIEYDVCDGARTSPSDFRCRVEFAADTKANVLEGVSCAVEVP